MSRARSSFIASTSDWLAVTRLGMRLIMSLRQRFARLRTCAAQWDVNKTNNTTGGMKWNQKGGGGYYSACNKRLKGEA